jgi:hypothetical protein
MGIVAGGRPEGVRSQGAQGGCPLPSLIVRINPSLFRLKNTSRHSVIVMKDDFAVKRNVFCRWCCLRPINEAHKKLVLEYEVSRSNKDVSSNVRKFYASLFPSQTSYHGARQEC